MSKNLKFNFQDLVDIPVLGQMLNKLYNVAGIPSAIIDMEGNVLTWSGGERICEDFFRKHPVAEKVCIQSDIKIRETISKGKPYAIYKCPYGLVDSCTPIVIEGHNIPKDLWLVDIDRGQMSRVIQNIVLNACQAMPGGGIIKISCENVTSVSGNTLPLTKDG